jgi:hypothetical protein
MPNGNQSPTRATQVKIIDPGNNIQVSIDVDSFMPNESVEISGYVAQNHGAYATINEFQPINAKLGQTAHLTVTAKPVPTAPAFQQGDDVMVFVRVAKVWVTVLGEGQAQPSGIASRFAGVGSVWGNLKGVAGPDSYSDEQEGNQSGSAAEYADQTAPDGASGSQAK